MADSPLAEGTVAFRCSQVKRLLLLSTYDSVGSLFYEGITVFTGDIYMTYRALDPPAGTLACVVSIGPLAASSLTGRPFPNCDHRFNGPNNSRTPVKAEYWALGYQDTFPNPAGTLQLYD